MADNNDTKDTATTTKTSKAATASAPSTDAAPAATSAPAVDTTSATAETTSGIVTQGNSPIVSQPLAVTTAPAGLYKVTHGTVTFGDGQRALTGATVRLSAEEATTMTAAGVVEPA